MTGNLTQLDTNARAVLKRFWMIFTTLFVLLLALAVSHYNNQMEIARVTLENNETKYVTLAQKGLTSELRAVISDLTFLAKLNELWDILDNPNGESARLLLSQEFLYFSEKKGLYDQIRVLDIDGKEVVRVNYGDGIPYIVGQTDLQDKSNRYYFHEAISQELGGIYMSPFDLNIEDGEIEQPQRPAIRFATPLYASNGKKQGILMLNFRGETLIQGFKQSAAEIADHINLLNNEGRWLVSGKTISANIPAFDQKQRFSNILPDEWNIMQSAEHGSFENDNGLFTYSTVYPMVSVVALYAEAGVGELTSVKEGPNTTESRYWKIVSHVPKQVLNTAAHKYLQQNVLFYIAAGLLLLVSSLILAQTSVRHRYEQAQQEFEKRFRNTLATIQLAAVTINKKGNIVFCNNFLLEMTGWQRNEVMERNWFEMFIPEQERQNAKQIFKQIIAGNAPPSTPEITIITKNGEQRILSANNTFAPGSDGNVTAITIIGQDVTEQRHSEEQLRKLSRAVDQSQNSIIITNSDGVIEYINPKFVEVSGYSVSEAIGKTCRILKSGETSRVEYTALWNTIKQGKQWRGMFHNKKKNGELYWEDTTITPIRNSNEEITHFLAIKEDITETLLLKEQLEEHNREHARIQTLAAMGRMATTIAHDLRNPLSSIKMALKIVSKQFSGQAKTRKADLSTAGELSSIALEQVLYMENILADILQFSEPDALQPEWLNINKLIDLAVSSSEKMIKERHADIVTEYQQHLPTIHGDATKLRRMFSNLIVNALDAADNNQEKARIKINTSLHVVDSVPEIQIDIKDNGCGIDTLHTEKLFEPFYTTRAKGTGLGLSIVKRIINQHSGSISLVSIDTGGTCASVFLPTGPIV